MQENYVIWAYTMVSMLLITSAGSIMFPVWKIAVVCYVGENLVCSEWNPVILFKQCICFFAGWRINRITGKHMWTLESDNDRLIEILFVEVWN